MRTLIFDGSPHRQGDTAALIHALRDHLAGESTIIRAYGSAISPCIDCRFCWNHPACAIKDGMQEIYGLIEKSDAIVIASPLYYSELTGPLLSLLSRLQVYYCARKFQGIRLIQKPKRGGILLAGGGNGGPENALATARMLLRSMGVKEIAPPALSLGTDKFPASQDQKALAQAAAIASFLEENE